MGACPSCPIVAAPDSTLLDTLTFGHRVDANGSTEPPSSTMEPELPATTEPVSVNDNPNLTDFEKSILNYHNIIREANGLPPLQWDKVIAQKAADWALYLKNNEQCVLRHPINTEEEKNTYIPDNLGQNLYSANGYPDNPASAHSAVSKWYNECSAYTPPDAKQSIPSNFEEVGHYTQLVWQGARKVGCAKIDCPKQMRDDNNVLVQTKGAIIACDYDQGNIGGQFNDMVPANAKCVGNNSWITAGGL